MRKISFPGVLMTLLLVSVPVTSVAQSLRDGVIQNHHAYIPADRGPFPTLIAIPGCSGISSNDPEAEADNPLLHKDDLLFRQHYRQMSEKLQREGFAVILLDINSAEGLLTACNREIASERSAGYINEAIAWARSQAYVDTNHINLIGWSMGGGGVLKWLHGPRSEAQNVRSAVAVYPGCGRHTNLTIPLPTLVMLGGSDDIAIPSVCQGLVDSSPLRQTITVVSYPGARHGFDISEAPAVLDIGKGMTIGYQREAAEASWLAILEFFRQAD